MRLWAWFTSLQQVPEQQRKPPVEAGWYVIREHGIPKLVQVLNVNGETLWRYGSQHHLRAYEAGLFETATRVEQ